MSIGSGERIYTFVTVTDYSSIIKVKMSCGSDFLLTVHIIC